MKFAAVLLVATLASSATAIVQFTNSVFNNVTAGKPFTLNWSGATGPVTITLKNGDPLNLKTYTQITSGQSGTSYTWDVPATLPADTYAFEISDGSATPNYSPQFQLIGGASATKSATISASNSTTTATPSASTTGSSASTTGSSTGSQTTSSATRTGSSTSSSATSSPTSAPSGNLATGIASNLALVFLVVGALMTLN